MTKNDARRENVGMRAGGLPPMPEDIYLAKTRKRIDWKRLIFISLGLGLFAAVYLSSPWPDAVDPEGEHFALTREGKAALGLFLLAATWWVFEVVPIGVTSITIGVVQALFLIRDRLASPSPTSWTPRSGSSSARSSSAWSSPRPA